MFKNAQLLESNALLCKQLEEVKEAQVGARGSWLVARGSHSKINVMSQVKGMSAINEFLLVDLPLVISMISSLVAWLILIQSRTVLLFRVRRLRHLYKKKLTMKKQLLGL